MSELFVNVTWMVFVPTVLRPGPIVTQRVQAKPAGRRADAVKRRAIIRQPRALQDPVDQTVTENGVGSAPSRLSVVLKHVWIV